MEVERPGTGQLSLDELRELDKLRVVIEQASADGVISKSERETISAIIYRDKKVSPQELDLVRQLINQKVASGELTLDYSS
ncbi:MAG: hypothetical protein ACFE0I_03330 [Elainellaceae cyanobacterium]